MRTAWHVLTDAGVPDGAARSAPTTRLDAESLARALEIAGGDARLLQPHERECLGAWLAAFRRHWPDRFAALLGPLGERVLERCSIAELDTNRYLKLRRIATANLARRV